MASSQAKAFVVAYVWWSATFVALTVLAGRPSPKLVEDNHRPEMIRMVAVYLPGTVSMLLATQRYIFDRHPLSLMSGVLAVMFILAVTTDQLVRAWESSDYSQRLSRSIGVLGATERQLRSLLDDLPAAVLVIDAHGVVREANAVAQTLTGRSGDELIGHHFSVIVRRRPPADDQPGLGPPAGAVTARRSNDRRCRSRRLPIRTCWSSWTHCMPLARSRQRGGDAA